MIAALAPVGATALAFLIESFLHRGNISLAYLLAVLVVAVRTGTGPALVCALISFFLYNFFFTEPRFSLMMMHREDILTVGLFLLMAAITGQQAVRLRERVLQLQEKNRFAKVQFELSQRLLGSIDSQEIYSALVESLQSVIHADFCVIQKKTEGADVVLGEIDLDDNDLVIVNDMLVSTTHAEANGHRQLSGGYIAVVLHNGKTPVAVLGLKNSGKKAVTEESMDIVFALTQQACLALARMVLLQDLQQERLHKERELLRSALLSSVSHDLRTPLSSMIGAATSLLELSDALSDNQKNELLESLLQESRRLDRYTQNLLDMTRLGHGELSIDRSWIGLDEIIGVVAKRVKPLIKGQHFISEIPDELPILYVHAALIEQALFNVLDNAIKFSPANSEIKISVSVNTHSQVFIDVSDQGPGIPPEERQRVFDMFHTVSRGDRHAAGTGLGLAICKGMISAHGGDVVIMDDADGHYSIVVRIVLPVIEPPDLSGDT